VLDGTTLVAEIPLGKRANGDQWGFVLRQSYHLQPHGTGNPFRSFKFGAGAITGPCRLLPRWSRGADLSLALSITDDLVTELIARARELGLLDSGPRFLTKKGLADHFGVEERTVKTWRSQGLPAYGPRAQMYDVEETEKWLARRQA
jgi:hypothetical protein